MTNKILMSMLRRRRPNNNKGKQRRRRTKKISIRAPLPYLPQTILEEIFRKLSLKDMARFKLVCSTWNSILSSPQLFKDVYYNNNPSLEGNSSLILFKYDYIRPLPDDDDDDNDTSYDGMVKVGSSLLSMQQLEDQKEWELPSPIMLLGTYNGLVALTSLLMWEDKLILWNPFTRKHSSVCFKGPSFVRNFAHLDFYCFLLCGLCYDASKDAYHVVVAWETIYQPTIDVSLHSFSDGTQRMIKSKLGWQRLVPDIAVMRKLCISRIGKVIRGLPHWAVNGNADVKTMIFYFDLEEEEFKDIAPPPDGGCGKALLDLMTTTREDQLGCVLHDIPGSCFEVWVMIEYGKPESWTNLYKIQYEKEFPFLGLTRHLEVLGSIESGEVLISLTLSFGEFEHLRIYFAYNVGKDELTTIKLEDEIFYECLLVIYNCHHKLTSPPISIEDE